jgi:pimeloyl-ACP methyl ester carboxylesterase
MKYIKILIIALFGLVSCVTYNNKNPYPDMEIVYYNNYRAYEFRDSLSDKLIIIFDGSSYDSTLGRFDGKKWRPVSLASQLVPFLRENYTILVPERLNRIIGENYIDDMDDRSNYTTENLVDCYENILNSFLEENNFTTVVLIGVSESAILLPLIYERIIRKDLVKGMVSFAGGGLSLYEGMEILSTSKVTPRSWKNGYSEMIKLYRDNGNNYPDSITEGFNGMSFRWYNSIINIRPYDYYENINIPILFVHGGKDYKVPIESTKYIENNFINKPYDFLYYLNMAHGPETYSQVIRLREDIVEWIMNNF